MDHDDQPKSQENPKIKIVEIGKYYFIHDGSKSGHPGLVISANDAENRYLVVRFDSDKFNDVPKLQRGVRHITKLNVPTSISVLNSYVHNRPMICKRKDIGKELTDISVSNDDMKTINEISTRNPEYAPSLRKLK